MTWLMLALRLVHIVGGVFWAGAVWVFARFIEPTATAAGPEGGRFLQRLAGSGYTPAVMSAALSSVLAGLALLWIDSGGFQSGFMGSPFGVTISIGALCAVLAAVFGIGMGARNAGKLKGLAATIQGQSGGPTAAQQAELAAIQDRLRTGVRLTAAFLVATVLCMAIARYV